MSQGLHHFHQRKRLYEKLESIPSPDKLKRLLDYAVYVGGSIGPFLTIPQLIKIWIGQNATGVSAFSWGSYLVASVFWVVYGIVHNEKPIIFTNSIWVLMNGLVMLGALIYG
jgi:MtN3 and saliva related transmembrane protein